MGACLGGSSKDESGSSPSAAGGSAESNPKSSKKGAHIEPGPEHTMSILVVGEMGVGKTSLAVRFCTGEWKEPEPSRPPLDFEKGERIVDLDGKKVKIEVVDTAGTERFRTISSNVYGASDGVLLVYSVVDKETLLSSRTQWMREINEYCPEGVKMLVGTKIDLPRVVDHNRGKSLAQEHEIAYIEVSAKDGTNVDQAFLDLGRAILNKRSGRDVI